MSIELDLLGNKEVKYGDSYKEHLLEIYKLYVDTADNISDRRQTANSFFLTINTAIIGASGYIQFFNGQKNINNFYILLGFVGIFICFVWYRLVLSYKGLNSAKFAVIQSIEQYLPIKPFVAEWTALEKGKNSKKYSPFTKIEVFVPLIFLALHLIITFFGIIKFFILPKLIIPTNLVKAFF